MGVRSPSGPQLPPIPSSGASPGPSPAAPRVPLILCWFPHPYCTFIQLSMAVPSTGPPVFCQDAADEVSSLLQTGEREGKLRGRETRAAPSS